MTAATSRSSPMMVFPSVPFSLMPPPLVCFFVYRGMISVSDYLFARVTHAVLSFFGVNFITECLMLLSLNGSNQSLRLYRKHSAILLMLSCSVDEISSFSDSVPLTASDKLRIFSVFLSWTYFCQCSVHTGNSIDSGGGGGALSGLEGVPNLSHDDLSVCIW